MVDFVVAVVVVVDDIVIVFNVSVTFGAIIAGDDVLPCSLSSVALSIISFPPFRCPVVSFQAADVVVVVAVVVVVLLFH